MRAIVEGFYVDSGLHFTIEVDLNSPIRSGIGLSKDEKAQAKEKVKALTKGKKIKIISYERKL